MSRNEGQVCDAVVRCIEKRTGDSRTKFRRPEKDGAGPPVDFRVPLGAREYAIEHTQIEATADFIRAGKKYKHLLGTLIDELSGTLPGPAFYAVHFPFDTHLGVKEADLARIRRDFMDWIREKAQCLYENNRERLKQKHRSPRYLDRIEAEPPGFCYPVSLWVRAAHSASERGALRHARLAPDHTELEALRAKRLRKALSNKCPKLQRCKEDGARTVLVLESNDIALTNHVLVGQCLAALSSDHADLPDEIYLVETDMDPWTVRCMKFDTECWPLDKLAEPVMFHEEDLINLSSEVSCERARQSTDINDN